MIKELLFSITKKDFIIETFRSGGKGGQHQNKTNSGVRIKHPESGAMSESRNDRSQHHNKTIAFRKLLQTKEWKNWFKLKCSNEMISKDVEKYIREKINLLIDERNLLVERKVDGKWVKETD